MRSERRLTRRGDTRLMFADEFLAGMGGDRTAAWRRRGCWRCPEYDNGWYGKTIDPGVGSS